MCLYIVSALKFRQLNLTFHPPEVRERILPNPRKSLLSASSEDVCDFGFSSHLSKTKRWKPLQSPMSMRFLVLLSESGLLKFSKNLNVNSKFGRHSFSENSFISKVFPSTSCIFVFTIGKIIARDSRLQYPFKHKFNSTLNILSSIANQTAGLALAMRFYLI